MPSRHCVLSLSIALTLLSACGAREPGPHDSERGEVIYWHLTAGVELTWDNCTDAADWEYKVKAPQYQGNMFFIYKVSADGSQAIDQDCDTTMASSCRDSGLGIVYKIEGHTLTWDPEIEVEDTLGSCDLGSDQVWTLTDGGETGAFEAILDISLVGDPATCAELDQQVKESAPNGLGLDGCRMTQRAELEYYPTDFPILRTVSGQR